MKYGICREMLTERKRRDENDFQDMNHQYLSISNGVSSFLPLRPSNEYVPQ